MSLKIIEKDFSYNSEYVRMRSWDCRGFVVFERPYQHKLWETWSFGSLSKLHVPTKSKTYKTALHKFKRTALLHGWYVL